MNSFKRDKVELPLSTVWLMNAIAEYKGKQELYVIRGNSGIPGN
jgi:hypothetical protein